MKTYLPATIGIVVCIGLFSALSYAAEFRYQGVQFSYDDTLAKSVIGENVSPEPRTHGLASLETGSPAHIRVSFDHETPPGIFDPRDAQLLIFPVDEYRVIFEVVAETIDSLRHTLVERLDSFEAGLPFLPPLPSTEISGIKTKFLDFQNGSGIRYLMSSQQEGSENPAKELFYTYQGLTADGKYYVSFVFPVVLDTGPDTNAFQPELFDMIIKSLIVQPESLENS